ncbi:hypothetical protein Nepgr_031918 [Nepenthes gracilis]|uniref:FAR1 domain-containing protein n=1 Tax=Nepenthes gracilis TaxID=150966 RepID=A0AAD3Y797_NEPGR|nr:hypothetical protein Nepgr_031918 [Nepenthes gracilis]
MDNCTPSNGMTFNCMNDAWIFWKQYGQKMGFGVRKKFVRKSKIDGVEIFRIFSCSKEGKRQIDKRQREDVKHRWETRCNCEARMECILVRESMKIVVKQFVGQHNHELDAPEKIHILGRHSTELGEDIHTWSSRIAAKFMGHCLRLGVSPIGREKIEAYLLKLEEMVDHFANVGVPDRRSQHTSSGGSIPIQIMDDTVNGINHSRGQTAIKCPKSCTETTKSEKVPQSAIHPPMQGTNDAPNATDVLTVQLPSLQYQPMMTNVHLQTAQHSNLSDHSSSQVSRTSSYSEGCTANPANNL